MKSGKVSDFSIFLDIEVRDKGFEIRRQEPICQTFKFFKGYKVNQAEDYFGFSNFPGYQGTR